MLDIDSPASPAAKAGGIFLRMDADWTALCADADVRAAVTDWLVTDHLADGVAAVTDSWIDDLGPRELLAALRPPGGSMRDELTDAVLRALLKRAAGRDRSAVLAARIVVQAMIPAAVRITRSQARPFGGRALDDIGHMTLVALYEVARSGRIHGRPGRPAANLALDALGRVCRDLSAEREAQGEDLARAQDVPDPRPGPEAHAHADAVWTAAVGASLEAGAAADATTARLELLELVLEAVESGALSPADGQAIAWHYRSVPVPDRQAAQAQGSTPAAWQRRRSRAVARLKSTVAA
ncbi:hypothetical protein [Streptomyces sp. 8L]|uniref:hypothetical protein n=1 Tax=Streptomyces sp. 8L TaxID=2877242 RepID=UPI001CD4CEAB|nr:hypothetical protein [Streptomyces sp. 8L]MCA1219295.1 hypothetical protein [Streptomyces sp. 8L]